MFRLFILLLVSTAELWVAQSKDNVAYHQIRKKYDHHKVNDITALSYVDLLIALAKKEKNYSELTYAYQDALNFEPIRIPQNDVCRQCNNFRSA